MLLNKTCLLKVNSYTVPTLEPVGGGIPLADPLLAPALEPLLILEEVELFWSLWRGEKVERVGW